MIYYGLWLNAGALSGNIFENNALNGIFDMLSKVIIFKTIKIFFIYFIIEV